MTVVTFSANYAMLKPRSVLQFLPRGIVSQENTRSGLIYEIGFSVLRSQA